MKDSTIVYRTTLRPALFGGLPDIKWEWHRPPAEFAQAFPEKEVSKFQYGEFVTERPLTDAELKAFQIEIVE